MGYAYNAATLIHAYCRINFPDRGHGGADMASTVFAGNRMDCFDHKGYSTHKYFDVDAVNAALGQPSGAGVYGRVVFADGSVVYLTCDGRLAYCDETGLHWAD